MPACLPTDGAAARAVPRVCARVPAAGAVRRVTRGSRPAEAVQVRVVKKAEMFHKHLLCWIGGRAPCSKLVQLGFEGSSCL